MSPYYDPPLYLLMQAHITIFQNQNLLGNVTFRWCKTLIPEYRIKTLYKLNYLNDCCYYMLCQNVK